MAGLTWSTITTPALTLEIRFRFGLSINGEEEDGTYLACRINSVADEEYATGAARDLVREKLTNSRSTDNHNRSMGNHTKMDLQ